MDSVNFKAISAGLGFHPFADGLPYAPVTQAPRAKQAPRATQSAPSFPIMPPSTKPMGTGAVMAGMPRVAPSIVVPRVQKVVPLAVQPQPTFYSSVPAPGTVPDERGIFFVTKRLIAYGIDQVLASAFCLFALGSVLIQQRLNWGELFANPVVIAIAAGFLFLLNWAVIATQEMGFGTSVGKKILGLRLTGSVGAVMVRSIFFLCSVGFLGIGILWAAFNRRRLCWHDLASGSEVE